MPDNRLGYRAHPPRVPLATSLVGSNDSSCWRELLRSQGVLLAQVISGTLTEHRVLMAVTAIYLAIGGTFLTLFNRPWPLRPMYSLFAFSWALITCAYLFCLWAQHPAKLKATLTPQRVLGAFVVPLLFVPAQVTFQSLKLSIGYLVGFPWDPILSAIDRRLHGGPAWHLVAPILNWPKVVEAGFLAYQSLWVFLAFGVLLWLAWHPHRTFRARGLVAVLLSWIVAGTIAAYLFASAGPCYSSEPWYQDQLARLEAQGSLLPALQRVHMRGQQMQTWHPFAGVSAFPSVHVTMAVLMAILTWTRSRRAGSFFIGFAVFTQVWSVLLAWHYAIDGYVGALIAVACWRMAGRLTSEPIARAQMTARSHVDSLARRAG